MAKREVFESGRAMAFGIVDYIGAIPAKFNDESDREFWRGYLAGECQRAADGLRSESEYMAAMDSFVAASLEFARRARKAA